MGPLLPCHYGWVIMFACSLSYAASATGHSFALAPFIDGWMSEMHISRPVISVFWTCAMVLSGILMPFVGSLLDRVGERRVLLACLPIVGGTVLVLAHATRPVVLLLAISVNRVVSADTLPMLGSITLNRWFVRWRGRASVVLGAMTAWLLCFPAIEIWLRDLTGSRKGAYQVIAVYVTACTCLAVLLWRDTPESVDLLPDFGRPVVTMEPSDEAMGTAESAKGAEPQGAQEEAEVSLTRAEAMRTGVFWALSAQSVNTSVLWVGCHFHLLDLFRTKGLEGGGVASEFYLTVSATRLAISFLLGMFCIDRLQRKAVRLLVAQVVPQSFVILMLLGYVGPRVWGRHTVVFFGFVYGVWGGIMTAVGSVIYAQLFGRKYLGSITGITKGFGLTSGALGPLFVGEVRERTGSYDSALYIMFIMTQLTTLALLMTPLPAVSGASPLAASRKKPVGVHISKGAASVPELPEDLQRLASMHTEDFGSAKHQAVAPVVSVVAPSSLSAALPDPRSCSDAVVIGCPAVSTSSPSA